MNGSLACAIVFLDFRFSRLATCTCLNPIKDFLLCLFIMHIDDDDDKS
jgi:hypothetical protein